MSGRIRRLMLLATIDARRPATWVAVAVAAAAVAVLAGSAPAGWPAPSVVALLLGAAIAVTALGDVAELRSPAGIDRGWLAERVAWPLLAWIAAAALRQDVPLLACGGVGILAAATLVAGVARRGATGADAASAALVVASAAVAAGWWAESLWPGPSSAATGAAVVVLGTAAAVGPRSSVRFRLRRALTAAGMIGAVAGMVAWLFLAANRAGLDLAASLAWFAALAVPEATLGDGVSHARVWRRLERAAARAAGGRLRLPPGRTRDGVFAVLTTGAILGWPPLVAALLAGADGGRSWPAAGVVMALAAAGTALLAVVWLGGRAGLGPATAQAAVLGGACLALATAMASGVVGPNCR